MNGASSTFGRKVSNPSGGAEADAPQYNSPWTKALTHRQIFRFE